MRARGLTHQEIAHKLQVSRSLITSDIAYLHACGLFLEAPSVLTKEEYFGKVMFHSEAPQSIQSSESEPRISYEINKDGTISFNFGDLLSNIPVFERLKWKQFYKGMRITAEDLPTNEKYKLLFFDIENTWELKTIKDYWRKKLLKVYNQKYLETSHGILYKTENKRSNSHAFLSKSINKLVNGRI